MGEGKVENQFDWFEYLVFCSMLLLSASIGIFFWCSKGGQHTVAAYYLGNKQMKVFPVAMSLVASFISGFTLLGIPSEIYNHGGHILFANLAEVTIFIINVTLYQPVFYNLQLISLYQYLEMRFDHRVRVLASALFATALILYMPVVIYGPALAFNQVSGLSVHIVSPLVCLVCIFYTTVGGLKAVVWADALQSTIMMLSLFIVITAGLSKVGGVQTVFNTAIEGRRLEMFNLDPDPTVRLTFWSSTIGITTLWISGVTSPAAAQRYMSLPTLNDARKATFLFLLGLCSFYLLSSFIGLLVYTNYRTCDPLSAKHISRPDQILPFFVLDVAGHLRGVPGLFVSGVVCAALSTLSTGMNTLAGTIYEDFIEPLTGKQSERKASNIMKILSVVIGIICVVLIFIVEKLGNIVDISAAMSGVTTGSIFGIFTMGVLLPRANAKGAFYGGLIAALFMIWTLIGHELASKCVETKPISVEGCPASLNSTIAENTCQEMSTAFKRAFPLYKVTAFYYGLLGSSTCITIGMIVSYFTGFNDPDKVNPELLSPVIRPSKPVDETKCKEIPLKTTNEDSNFPNHTLS